MNRVGQFRATHSRVSNEIWRACVNFVSTFRYLRCSLFKIRTRIYIFFNQFCIMIITHFIYQCVSVCFDESILVRSNSSPDGRSCSSPNSNSIGSQSASQKSSFICDLWQRSIPGTGKWRTRARSSSISGLPPLANCLVSLAWRKGWNARRSCKDSGKNRGPKTASRMLRAHETIGTSDFCQLNN